MPDPTVPIVFHVGSILNRDGTTKYVLKMPVTTDNAEWNSRNEFLNCASFIGSQQHPNLEHLGVEFANVLQRPVGFAQGLGLVFVKQTTLRDYLKDERNTLDMESPQFAFNLCRDLMKAVSSLHIGNHAHGSISASSVYVLRISSNGAGDTR